MSEQPQFSAVSTSEHKRRKVEVETVSGQLKAERTRLVVTDRAKANYVRVYQREYSSYLTPLALRA